MSSLIACTIRIKGLVQGVGFRPHVWHCANELGVLGTVCNDGQGVYIECWVQPTVIQAFLDKISRGLPPLARIDSMTTDYSDKPCLYRQFSITQSQHNTIQTGIVPDAAMCGACRVEIFEPSNRRYRYPFTNCTHCGPRLSIVQGIPYDRANTSMAKFQQCPECLAEYTDPANRRFHAQPNACPVCGPQLWLEDNQGQKVKTQLPERDALDTANRLLKQGAILAIMGLGGVHLVCDATQLETVKQLRLRKHRYQKPLALMARDVEVIKHYVFITEPEAGLLASAAAPIVLLKRLEKDSLPEIAPAQHYLGFMLPYTPLHALLLAEWDTPLVMTSANMSEEPQCISVEETRQRMQGIADYLLLHDRLIVNRVDDSVVRVMVDTPTILRRARGYAPSSFNVSLEFAQAPAVLAMGGELKNTFALLRDGQITLAQHLGDLENAKTWREYEYTLQLYQQLLAHEPQAIIVDKHPSYRSSQWGRQLAKDQQLPLIEVQHHHAHMAACMAENGWQPRDGKVLGIILDGLGFGEDGTIWGGEFLVGDYVDYQRLAYLKPVPMPGGTQAILQPWRNTWAHLQALGWDKVQHYCQELELIQFLQAQPLATLASMLANNMNSPMTSSCGRLFDAVAAALNCSREQISYEGQAAIELEAITPPILLDYVADYPFALEETKGQWIINPQTMWCALLHDLKTGYDRGAIAAQFLKGLVQVIIELALKICQSREDIKAIVLSGGVFQNVLLWNSVKTSLEQAGKQVLVHKKFPTNDGGLALGQAVIGATQLIR